MKLALQWFIEQHSGWEELLQQKPYCITIARDEMFGRKLIMFKYSQIESDFNVELVRECRGIILDEETNEVVCFPFMKFGNYGESYCPEINWKDCWVAQKLDGSLIKVVRLGQDLLISTNGMIDAFKAPLAEQIGCRASSFGELVLDALFANDKIRPQFTHEVEVKDYYQHPDIKKAIQNFTNLLDEGVTYIFELTSPFNKVVVQWHETKLNFLGCRDNRTYQEIHFSNHKLKDIFNTPVIHPLRSLDECISAAEQLDVNEEGYVVCDRQFNRVKVKSPVYIAIHHLRGENGVMSYRRALEIIKHNEMDEVLTYFPEYKPSFDDLHTKFMAKVLELTEIWNQFSRTKHNLITRKDQAIWITSHSKTPGLLFAMLDNKISSIRDGLYSLPNESILKMLGYA